jgi:hypothetical protein
MVAMNVSISDSVAVEVRRKFALVKVTSLETDFGDDGDLL